MPAQRPLVLVYQEFASLSVTPATPDLNCLIAGPCYWIQDFPDNRSTILLDSAYGTLNAANVYTPPVADTTIIALADAPNNKVGAVLDTASVRVFFGSPRAHLAQDGDTINSLVMSVGTTAESLPTLTITVGSFLDAGVKVGDIVILTDASLTHTLVRTVRTVTATVLTFTSEMPLNAAFAAGAAIRWRVERQLPDTEIDASFIGTVPATNEINILGGVTLPVNNVAKVVNYALVYVMYRSLRHDLAALGTVNNVVQAVTKTGLIDARNPLATGLSVALQNTSTAVQCFGVTSDDLTGYTAMKSSISGRKDVYAVVPLRTDPAVLKMLDTEFQNLADPSYALTNGVPQKFRVVVGAPTALPVTKTVEGQNTDGQVVGVTGTAPAGTKQITVTGATFITTGVLPGDTLVMANDANGASRDGSYVVVQVVSETVLLTATAFPAAATAAADVKVLVGITVSVRMTNLVGASSITAAGPILHLDLFDTNATFLDDGVLPGDLIQMPRHPSATDFTVADTFVVATVVSNQRLRIVNNGRNTALVANELPYGATRIATVTLVPTTATLSYKVLRTLDKDGQVAALVAVAGSFASRRTVLCWPDSVDVTDLVDGSLPRALPAVPAAAGSQPGYYLACAVGGMTAGLPSHQGLTNLGIAGITTVHNATPYFDDKQISAISNNGWLVFQQDTAEALPYIVHGLTSDPSALEFGEFMMVKNFDFVSMFYADIIAPFIGTWNISQETIGFIDAALQAGTGNLKLRKRIRIGAPIIEARITSLAQSKISSDRLEAFIEVDFPKPLNTVGLHLVSVAG